MRVVATSRARPALASHTDRARRVIGIAAKVEVLS